MIRVLVTNTKGGCGKTTLAVTLASAFAGAGIATALADVDRQQSSLSWLGLRPSTAAPITGLDWRKDQRQLPAAERLVIDVPAGLKVKEVEELLGMADLVVVPVLASPFDEASTARFVARLDELKPVRKGKKAVLLVANRLRSRTRAAQRLDLFLQELGHEPIARIGDRTAYGELALQGLGLFDDHSKDLEVVRAEWHPLLGAIDA